MNRLTVFEIAVLANLAITHVNKTEDKGIRIAVHGS